MKQLSKPRATELRSWLWGVALRDGSEHSSPHFRTGRSVIRGKRTSASSRFLALALSLAFLLFLSLSQPHRVHHFFEGHHHSHDSSRADSDNHHEDPRPTNPAQTQCAVQSVTQSCQIGQVELIQLAFLESHAESFHPHPRLWVDSFTAFSFFQRAPPSHLL
jgi:hypothetical protein